MSRETRVTDYGPNTHEIQIEHMFTKNQLHYMYILRILKVLSYNVIIYWMIGKERLNILPDLCFVLAREYRL